MEKEKLHLIVEINQKNLALVAGSFDENQNFKIIEKELKFWVEPKKNIFDNFFELEKIIQNNLETIENKLGYIFEDIILILDDFNYNCLNVSGFKKLNGSQLLKDNITYILNSLKSNVSDSEQKKTILHIFNSRSTLDEKISENLPIGLFGTFYTHELSFLLAENNDLKNIKKIFGKSNLKIKKIFIKNFIEGIQLSNYEKKIDNFYRIKINKKNSQIFFFDKGSLRFSEQFNFGTDMIIQDLCKICSLKADTIIKMLSNNVFINDNYLDDDFLEEKNFNNENFRKIKKRLFKDISDARIEEILKIIFHKNINIKTFKRNIEKIFFLIDDNSIFKNFENSFNNHLSLGNKIDIQLINEFDLENTISEAVNLSKFGWRKEAVPITQTKNTLITRIFKYFFG